MESRIPGFHIYIATCISSEISKILVRSGQGGARALFEGAAQHIFYSIYGLASKIWGDRDPPVTMPMAKTSVFNSIERIEKGKNSLIYLNSVELLFYK